MNLHYDKETGRANEIIEKELSNTYRESIEKIVNYLSLEVLSIIGLLEKSRTMYLIKHINS